MAVFTTECLEPGCGFKANVHARMCPKCLSLKVKITRKDHRGTCTVFGEDGEILNE
jgi:Zn finger protein HypA/HybF involved in hydrogenase expression